MAQSSYQQLFLWMQEEHCSLDRAINVLMKKKDLWAMDNVY